MRFPRLLTGFGTLLVLACCYEFGVEIVEHGIEPTAPPLLKTQWVVEERFFETETETDSWFSPVDRDTSLCWEAHGSGELRMRLRIRRDLPYESGQSKPEDVVSTLELGLGGRNRRAANGRWYGDLFRQVLEPWFLPWFESIDDCRWIKSRNIIVLQVTLVDGSSDGSSDDAMKCLMGIDTDAQLLFVSRLPAQDDSWRVEGMGRYVCTANERIDLSQWTVEQTSGSISDDNRLSHSK